MLSLKSQQTGSHSSEKDNCTKKEKEGHTVSKGHTQQYSNQQMKGKKVERLRDRKVIEREASIANRVP